jgi:hypothetical protein
MFIPSCFSYLILLFVFIYYILMGTIKLYAFFLFLLSSFIIYCVFIYYILMGNINSCMYSFMFFVTTPFSVLIIIECIQCCILKETNYSGHSHWCASRAGRGAGPAM